MGDFKLPEINPIAVDRQPEMYERAGAQVNQAFQQGAEVASGLDKARVMVQAQEAAIKRKQEINAFHAEVDANPVMSADFIRQKFGYEVPPEVEKLIYQHDGAVPNYAVAPLLLAQVEKRASENAVKGINGAGWQQKAALSFAADSVTEQEQHREKMSNLEQMVLTQKSSLNFANARAAEDVPTMQAIAATTPNPVIRAQMENEIPKAQRDFALAAMARTSGPFEVQLEQVRELRKMVESNDYTPTAREKDPTRGPNAFPIALDAKEKAHWLSVADAKEQQIVKAQYDAKLQAFDSPMQEVSNLPPALRQQWLDQHPEFTVPTGLKDEDFNVRWNWLEKMRKGEDIKDDDLLYASLTQRDYARLRQMSLEQVQGFKYSFTDATRKELVREWGRLKEGKEPSLGQFTERFIEAALESWQLDLKKAPTKEARDLYFSQIVRGLYQLKASKGPDYFIGQEDVSHVARQLIAPGSGKTYGDYGYRDADPGAVGAAQFILKGAGSVPVRTDVVEKLLRDTDTKKSAIDAAWKTWASEQTITPADRVRVYAEATRRRVGWEDKIRQGYAAEGQTPPADISEDLLFESIIASKFASIQSKEKHPAIRSARETARDREIAQAQADKDAAATRAASAAERAKEKRDLFLQGGVR
jgi:hypothetical protein